MDCGGSKTQRVVAKRRPLRKAAAWATTRDAQEGWYVRAPSEHVELK